MLNCQQVKSIYAATQEELQDLMNDELRKLGKRVQQIDFVNPLCEGYGVNIIYWSQDISATMTCKLETLPDDPQATDESKLFVCVMHEHQRQIAYQAIETMYGVKLELSVKFPQIYTKEKVEAVRRTLERFAPDNTEEQLE